MSLVTYRKAKGLSAANLAKMVGISEIAVFKYEQNPDMLRAAGYDKVVRIAEVLKCEPQDLVSEDNRPYGDTDIICAVSKGKRYINSPCYFGDCIRDVLYAAERDHKLMMEDISEDDDPFLASDGHSYRMFIPSRLK